MTKETRDGTDAIRCDRCGTLYRKAHPHHFADWAALNGSVVGETESEVDICPRCIISLREWWEDWRRQWNAKLAEYGAVWGRPCP